MDKKFTKYRVLVIDDHMISVKLLTRQLEAIGFCDIDFAANGAEALEIMKSKNYDIITLDWVMPVMNGEDFLMHCRKDKQYNNVAFVTISSEAQRDSILSMMNRGATSYLTKPVIMEELSRHMDAVVEWIERKSQ